VRTRKDALEGVGWPDVANLLVLEQLELLFVLRLSLPLQPRQRIPETSPPLRRSAHLTHSRRSGTRTAAEAPCLAVKAGTHQRGASTSERGGVERVVVAVLWGPERDRVGGLRAAVEGDVGKLGEGGDAGGGGGGGGEGGRER
jgi:hypothetical protein